jgi:hypothetical protein
VLEALNVTQGIFFSKEVNFLIKFLILVGFRSRSLDLILKFIHAQQYLDPGSSALNPNDTLGLFQLFVGSLRASFSDVHE